MKLFELILRMADGSPQGGNDWLLSLSRVIDAKDINRISEAQNQIIQSLEQEVQALRAGLTHTPEYNDLKANRTQGI